MPRKKWIFTCKNVTTTGKEIKPAMLSYLKPEHLRTMEYKITTNSQELSLIATFMKTESGSWFYKLSLHTDVAITTVISWNTDTLAEWMDAVDNFLFNNFKM